jgi:hypothetical protein
MLSDTILKGTHPRTISTSTGPIATKLWWNDSWMAPFQKMAAKLKIEKQGDEILIVHWYFSISQNELKF